MKFFNWLLFYTVPILFVNTALATDRASLCENLNGTWRNEVLGKLIAFKCQNNNKLLIASYHFTKNSYVLQQNPTTINDDELKNIHLIENRKINLAGDVYFKTNEFPSLKPIPPGSALENCKILTENFKQHYGYFNLRNVDFNQWQKQCDSAIYMHPFDIDFFNLISTMLSQFKDNHIMLSKNIENDVPDYFGFNLHEPFATNLSNELNKYNKEHKQSLSNSDFVDQVLTPEAQKYLLNQISQLNSFNGINIFWGTIKNHPSIVYLYIQSMAIDKIEEVNLILDRMVSYIKINKIIGIIVDVRFNQGGDDRIGQLIMSHFIDKNKTAYLKQSFYNGNTWTQPRPIVVEPAKKNTAIPVALLISPITASAAESFSLAMLSLPQVKLIGENTMGIFSDQFPRKLPNGWWITLSNEKMLSADKKISYEKVGLPPAEITPFPFLDYLNQNGDTGIKAAVNYITNYQNNKNKQLT